MIRLEITNGPESAARLRVFPERLGARLAVVMQSLGVILQDRVRDKLGGQVLRERSGRLAAAVDFDITTGTDAGGAVAVNVGGVPYAAYQEFGFHGTETVRAHLRLVKAAFGRAIPPRDVAVQSYARRVDYPAHSYLRAALDDVAPDASARIDDAAGEEAAA